MFADRLVDKTKAEEATFAGITETHSPLKERIGVYWDFLNRPDLDGGDTDVPWSAAFISYMVHLAGAGSAFPYSAQHSVYFYRTINDKLIKKATPFWGFRPADVTVQPGDIIGMNREGAPRIDYDWAAHHADYNSHADIVVDVTGTGTLNTIGGNVSNRIGKKTFNPFQGTFRNAAAHSQHVFVVIRAFLP